MKYFSLFSGIGGFEYGIEQANIHRSFRGSATIQPTSSIKSLEARQSDMERLGNNASGNSRPPTVCVGFSEIDKYAIQIYKKHFPSHKEYGDVTNIKCSDVPDFSLLVAGFPCQSFSIAGKREGFNSIRGTLFFEIARIAQEKQPRLLLLENVKGLLSHDKGRTFGTILNILDELGYDLQWQVLNSKNFGVPQNRERVFIIGHLRTTSRPQVFPLRQTNEIYPQDDNRTLSKCLDSNYHKGWLDHGQRTFIRTDELSSRPERDKSNSPNSIRRASYSDDMRIRRLTPTECERLQGFPDGWTEGISDTQRYKCLGNAVTVNVISAIMEKLLDFPRRVCYNTG